MKEVFLKEKKANLLALCFCLPIMVVLIFPFIFIWSNTLKSGMLIIKESLSVTNYKITNNVIILITPILIVFIGIVIHELIHGFTMLLFAKKKNSSIKFGVTKFLTPYAHFKEPISAKKMLIIALAPFVFLGLFPYLYSFFTGNLVFLFFGSAMTLGSIGDFLYAYLIFKNGLNNIILDHEDEMGFKIVYNGNQ